MTQPGRIIAAAIAISAGIVVLLGYFIPLFSNPAQILLGWAGIVIVFALLPGVVNLLRVHFGKIKNREKSYLYSVALIASLAATLVIGWPGGPASLGGKAIFEYVLRPLESTFFALLAFFIASAAYRAFRIESFETFLFAAFAIIVLLGQVPAGYQLWPDLPLIKEWVMRVPALAGARGILLGVALGTIATGIRVLLGADRPYADTE